SSPSGFGQTILSAISLGLSLGRSTAAAAGGSCRRRSKLSSPIRGLSSPIYPICVSLLPERPPSLLMVRVSLLSRVPVRSLAERPTPRPPAMQRPLGPSRDCSAGPRGRRSDQSPEAPPMHVYKHRH